MTPLETVRKFVERINAHDISGLAALLSPDHRLIDSLGSIVSGHDAVRDAWRQYFQMIPDYHITINRSFSDAVEVVLLGVARGTYNRATHLRAADAWQTPAAWRAVVRDDTIAEWQVYADNEPLRQRMTQASA